MSKNIILCCDGTDNMLTIIWDPAREYQNRSGHMLYRIKNAI